MTNSPDLDQFSSPTDLDLHCLQRQDISEFSRTRVNKLFWCLQRAEHLGCGISCVYLLICLLKLCVTANVIRYNLSGLFKFRFIIKLFIYVRVYHIFSP